MRGSTTLSVLLSSIFFFVGICYSSIANGQSIENIILDCTLVNGNVESATVNIKEWEVSETIIERSYTQVFDKKRRLISLSEFANENFFSKQDYHYIKNKLIKKDIYFLGKFQGSYFYQYDQEIPLKIMTVNKAKELLSISRIYFDSLYRPLVLKKQDLSDELILRQIVQYDEPNNRFLVQTKRPEEKPYIYQYQMCSSDNYLETIPSGQFRSYIIKVLKITKENNMATIVKAVTAPDGKEDIHIQEIEFDQKDNWVKSNLYRLKKRKQKKILLQQIERTLVYR